jgi:hypothetical protein
MGMDHVGGLIVVDIVEGVASVPGNNQAGQLEGGWTARFGTHLDCDALGWGTVNVDVES